MTGLGFIIGPLFGSVTVYYGGFSFPFAVVGVVYALLMPIIGVGLTQARKEQAVEEEVESERGMTVGVGELL